MKNEIKIIETEGYIDKYLNESQMESVYRQKSKSNDIMRVGNNIFPFAK